ncbi:hypothetical protein HDU67_003778 [Dinochytrium kinnereticum]|nr:hypothetical protein HDU67_003778 [Dinochytrium kinnereticum]
MPPDISDAVSDTASVDMEQNPPPSFYSGDTTGHGLAPVRLIVNGMPFEVMEGTPISLSLLNLGPNYLLYVNDTYIQMSQDGMPIERLNAASNMVLTTIDTLQSTWGLVIYNCFIAIVTALLARPLIKRAGSTSEIVVSVISGARILDSLLRDTIYKLLSQGTLTRRMFLLALLTAQLAAMIAGSISLNCLSLFEFRAIPIFIVLCEVVFPLIHAGWIMIGVLEKAGSVSNGLAVVGGVVFPVIVMVGLGGFDLVMRARMGWSTSSYLIVDVMKK